MNINQILKKLILFVAIAFFSFIVWIIYLANTGQNSIFFEFVDILPYGDKLGHFFLFGFLSLAANFAFKLKTFSLFSRDIYIGSIIVFSFALIEELSQYFFPNRTLDIIDLIADILGILMFTLLTKLLKKKYL